MKFFMHQLDLKCKTSYLSCRILNNNNFVWISIVFFSEREERMIDDDFFSFTKCVCTYHIVRTIPTRSSLRLVISIAVHTVECLEREREIFYNFF